MTPYRRAVVKDLLSHMLLPGNCFDLGLVEDCLQALGNPRPGRELFAELYPTLYALRGYRYDHMSPAVLGTTVKHLQAMFPDIDLSQTTGVQCARKISATYPTL